MPVSTPVREIDTAIAAANEILEALAADARTYKAYSLAMAKRGIRPMLANQALTLAGWRQSFLHGASVVARYSS